MSSIYEEMITYLHVLSPKFVNSSITDSFTILVGFIAIGIPLSLQVVSRATERYKSDYLVKYLSSWRCVTPQSIYWASISYISLALIYRALVFKFEPGEYPIYVYCYAWVLMLVYSFLLLVVGFWYHHLFTQMSKRPKEIYNDLKK